MINVFILGIIVLVSILMSGLILLIYYNWLKGDVWKTTEDKPDIIRMLISIPISLYMLYTFLSVLFDILSGKVKL